MDVVIFISFLALMVLIAFFTGRRGKSKMKEKIEKLARELEHYKIPQDQLEQVREELAQAMKDLEELEDESQFTIVGIPSGDSFTHETSDEYREALKEIRENQKKMVKDKTAVNYQDWTITGAPKAQSRQLTNHMISMALRAFNGEAQVAITKVKWNNYDASYNRIMKAFKAVNKLGTRTQVTIAEKYLNTVLYELQLVHELEEFLYEEKQEQAEIRARMREEEQAQKEAEKALKEAAQEEARWEKALAKAREEANQGMTKQLSEKVKELQAKLEEAAGKKARAVSLAELTKIGHVYVVSNIGSFGEDVYKIGMTRRFEPMDRVKELSSASVPFPFDVHAMIYSEDAPALERALHKELEGTEVNKMNSRKEFFRVSLEDLTRIAEELGVQVKWTKTAEAREFRQTQEK